MAFLGISSLKFGGSSKKTHLSRPDRFYSGIYLTCLLEFPEFWQFFWIILPIGPFKVMPLRVNWVKYEVSRAKIEIAVDRASFA